jgi:hypothetical protein
MRFYLNSYERIETLETLPNCRSYTETGKVVLDEIWLSEEWLSGVAFSQQRMRTSS